MKYFTMEELCKSSKADSLKISNVAGKAEEVNLTALVNNVLDPLRGWYGKPIKVTSGYRNPVVNKAVGGKETSQHLKGEAADINTGSFSENKKIFEYIQKNLPFDQLIDESNFSWVHVSYKANGANRKQVLSL